MSNPLHDALKKEDIDLFHQLLVHDASKAIQHLTPETVSCLRKFDYRFCEDVILMAFNPESDIPRQNLSVMLEYSVFIIRQRLEKEELDAAFRLIRSTFQMYEKILKRNLVEEVNLFALYFERAYYHLQKNELPKAEECIRRAFLSPLRYDVLVHGDAQTYYFRILSAILTKMNNPDIEYFLYDYYKKITKGTIASAIGTEELSMPKLLSVLREFQSRMRCALGESLNLDSFIDYLESKVKEPTVLRTKLVEFIILYLNSLVLGRVPPKGREATPLEKKQEAIQISTLLFLFNITPNINFSDSFAANSSLFSRSLISPMSLHIAEALVKAGADCNVNISMQGRITVSLVSLVSTLGNCPGVRLLMEHGADPNTAPNALLAALLNDEDEVALYLAGHEKVLANPANGLMTPLDLAVNQMKREIVQVLKARGAVEDSPSPPKVETPAPEASKKEKKPKNRPPKTNFSQQRQKMREHIRKNDTQALLSDEMKRFILSADSIDPETGSHPIHIACELGAQRALECLVNDVKVDINATNPFGNTAVHIACERKHYSAIGFLVGGNAKLHEKNLQDKSPRDLCDEKGRQTLFPNEIVKKRSPKKKKTKSRNGHAVVKTSPDKTVSVEVSPSSVEKPVEPTTDVETSRCNIMEPATPAPETLIPDLVFPKYSRPKKLISSFQEVHRCLWAIRECQRFYKPFPNSEVLCRQAMYYWLCKFFVALNVHYMNTRKPLIPYKWLQSKAPPFPDPKLIGNHCAEYLLDFFASKISLTQQDVLAAEILKNLSEADTALCTEEWVEGLLESCVNSRAPLCDLTPFLAAKSNGNSANAVVESRLC